MANSLRGERPSSASADSTSRSVRIKVPSRSTHRGGGAFVVNCALVSVAADVIPSPSFLEAGRTPGYQGVPRRQETDFPAILSRNLERLHSLCQARMRKIGLTSCQNDYR